MIRARIRRRLALPMVLLMLAACSSTRTPSGTAPDKRANKGASSADARRGGYYLDDGPGDAPPRDLDAIPDAVPRAEPLNPRTARPYVVFERRYVPMTALEPYRQRGVATWYGRRYHGQRTSNGEVYDMYAMTAAHPTLPIPSYVRVTHLGNGRSVVVRVNDRGPFLGDRLIDLSYTAAAKLGYVNAGSAEDEVELITRFGGDDGGLQASVAPAAGDAAGGSAGGSAGSEGLAAGPERLELETVVAPVSPTSTPAASGDSASGPQRASSGASSAAAPSQPSAAAAASAASASGMSAASAGVFLQFGAFSSRASAEAARARLSRDLAGLVKDIEVRQEGALFKVHAGPYEGRADALAAAQRVERAGTSRPVVVAR